MIEATGVTFTFEGADRPAVSGVDFSLKPGEMVALVGPNGGGKTTLLKLLLGILRPDSGRVLIEGKPAADLSRREVAQMIGVVSQREEPVFPMKVEPSVMLGRYPHLGAMGAPTKNDREVVDQAMRRTEIDTLADRWVSTLSGGEWQRVRIARALAQEPRVLALDEPTASLDLRHEMRALTLTLSLVRDSGLAAVIVTHNVNLAARFADRMVVLKDGQCVASGEPGEILTATLLEDVFAWPVEIFDWHGTPQFVPKTEVN